MYHRFGIITESDVINSMEMTNTLKPVRVSLAEVFAGVERSEVAPDHSMFCLGFLGWAGWVMSADEFDCAVQLDNSQFDEEGRPCVAGPGLYATYHLLRRCFEC